MKARIDPKFDSFDRLSRGIITWAALLIICVAIWSKGGTYSWALSVFVAITVVGVGVLFIIGKRNDDKEALKSALRRFFCEVGGGF